MQPVQLYTKKIYSFSKEWFFTGDNLPNGHNKPTLTSIWGDYHVKFW